MGVVAIILVSAFSITLSLVELPKMVKNKEHIEIAAFSVILLFGTVISVLKSLDVRIPNPAEFVAWIYAPVVDLIKGALE